MALAWAMALALGGCATGDRQWIPVVMPAFDWKSVNADTGRIGDVPGLEALARDFPDSSSVRLRLLNARLQANDAVGAWADLIWLADHGHVFSKAGRDELLSLYSGEHRNWLSAHLPEAPASLDGSTALATVPPEAQLVESVVRDGNSGRLFASTIVSRQIYVQEPTADWKPLILDDADSLSGLVLDRSTHVLWVASGSLGAAQPAPGAFHGLIGVDTRSLREMRRIPAPEGVNPSDVALGPDGTLYVSDPVGGGIYSARTDAVRLSPLVAPGTFRSPQGLAISQGGTRLFVSDYRYGLAAVMLGDAHTNGGRVLRLWNQHDPGFPLDGIDGLWRHGSWLIAMQNGTNPQRILALDLAYGESSFYRFRVLEQANPAWTEPLGGTVADGQLIYVATGQWAAFGSGGALSDGASPRPTELRTLPLGETPAPPP